MALPCGSVCDTLTAPQAKLGRTSSKHQGTGGWWCLESVLLRTAHFLSAQLAWPTSRQAHRYMAQRCILLIKPWREGSPPEARGVAPDTPPAGTDNWRKSHKQQTLITAADSQAPCGVVSDPPLASWTPREVLKRRNRQGVCTRLSVLILFFLVV